MPKRIVTLAALLASAACTAEPAAEAAAESFPLAPLSEADLAPYSGYVCQVQRDGSVIYISDTETGAVRHGGKLVRLVPSRPEAAFDPADDRTLAMTTAAGNPDALSLTIQGRPGETVSDDATESLTRPVRITIASGAGDEARPFAFDADLICAS
jgi:hypothetical protein